MSWFDSIAPWSLLLTCNMVLGQILNFQFSSKVYKLSSMSMDCYNLFLLSMISLGFMTRVVIIWLQAWLGKKTHLLFTLLRFLSSGNWVGSNPRGGKGLILEKIRKEIPKKFLQVRRKRLPKGRTKELQRKRSNSQMIQNQLRLRKGVNHRDGISNHHLWSRIDWMINSWCAKILIWLIILASCWLEITMQPGITQL